MKRLLICFCIVLGLVGLVACALWDDTDNWRVETVKVQSVTATAPTAAPTATVSSPVVVPTTLPPPRVYTDAAFGVVVEYAAVVADLAGTRDGDAFGWTRPDGEGLVFVPGVNLLDMRPIPANQPAALAIQSGGERIVTGSTTGAIEIWNARTGQREQALGAVTGQATSIAFNEDETRLVVGVQGRHQGGDGSVALWSNLAESAPKVLPSYGAVTRVAFAEDGTIYFSTNANSCSRGGGGVFAWDGITTESKRLFDVSGNSVLDFSIATQDEIIASVAQASESRCTGTASVAVWNPVTGEVVRALTEIGVGSENQTVLDATSVAFRRDGKILAVGDAAGGLHFWDWQANKVVGSYELSSTAVSRVIWLENGMLLVKDNDGYVRLLHSPIP